MAANEHLASDKMLETVRKLLAKAEGTNVQAEADTFIQKAQELMEKYAIDQALLDQTRPADKQAVPVTIDVKMADWWAHKQIFLAQCGLLAACSRHNRCQHWVTTWCSTGHIAGFSTDARYVEMLFTSLYLQMESRFAVDAIPIKPDYKSKAKRGKVAFKPLNVDQFQELKRGPNYRVEYMLAFAERINQRLAEMHDTGASTALVLANVKDRVDGYVDSLNLELTPIFHNAGQRDETARKSGAKAADRANLRPGAGLRSTPEIGA